MIYGAGINNLHGYSSNKNKSTKLQRKIYNAWRNMIKVCHSSKYSTGCTMDRRWLILSNFVEDLPKIPGYDKWIVDDSYSFSKWKNGYSKHYSLDTVEFLPQSLVAQLQCEYMNRKDDNLMNNEIRKPVVELIGQDGNIFNLVGIASRELRKHGMSDEASKMQEEVFASSSYDEALQIMMKYVDIV